MSIRSKILELLTKNKLTSKEIHDRLYDPDADKLNIIQIYINQFKNEGKIEKVGNMGKFAIYSIKKTELEKLKMGYKQFNKLFEDITKNAERIIKNNELGFLKQLIKENIDTGLIKQINSEMI